MIPCGIIRARIMRPFGLIIRLISTKTRKKPQLPEASHLRHFGIFRKAAMFTHKHRRLRFRYTIGGRGDLHFRKGRTSERNPSGSCHAHKSRQRRFARNTRLRTAPFAFNSRPQAAGSATQTAFAPIKKTRQTQKTNSQSSASDCEFERRRDGAGER